MAEERQADRRRQLACSNFRADRSIPAPSPASTAKPPTARLSSRNEVIAARLFCDFFTWASTARPAPANSGVRPSWERQQELRSRENPEKQKGTGAPGEPDEFSA
jgi:hypothetical protein